MVVQNDKKAPRFQTARPKQDNAIPPRAGRKIRDQEKVMSEEIAVFDKEIAELNQKIAALDTSIAAKKSENDNRQNFNAEREKLTAEINELQKKTETNTKEREDILKQLDAKRKDLFEKRLADKESRKNVSHASDSQVAQQVAELEQQLQNSKLNLKDERDIKRKLADLTRTSHMLRDVKKNPHNEAAGSDDTGMGALQTRLDAIKKENDQLFNDKRKLLEKRRNLSTLQEESVQDVRPLLNERDVLKRERQTRMIKRDDTRDKLMREIKIWKAEDEESERKKAIDRAEARAQEQFDLDLRSLQRELANVEAPVGALELSDFDFVLETLKKEAVPRNGKSKFALDFELITVLAKHKVSIPTSPEGCTEAHDAILKKKTALLRNQEEAKRTVDQRRAAIQAKIDAHKSKGPVVAPFVSGRKHQEAQEEYSDEE